MAINFNAAVNAYRQVAENAAIGKSTPSPISGDGNSFSSLVSDSLKQTVATGRAAEELSLRQIAGEADLKDVITAVANAEHTLETVVAVRDKVLTAYQEILRMPI